MSADELEELIRRLVAQGVTVLLFVLGPAGEPVAVAPGPGAASPPATGQDDRQRDRPSLDLDRDPPVSPDELVAPPDDDTPATPADPDDSPGPAPSEDGTTSGGGDVTIEGTTAAATQGWGEPVRTDDFTDGTSGWSIYDGPGHAGNGRRTPDAVSVRDGVLTITGDSAGNTAGMAWTAGSRQYGRWEGRVRAPASDPSYNALLLLWPTAENFPVGGEIDFMEMTDHTRQKTNLFLHYGEDNSQVQGSVDIDATQWHNWAVEWTPKGVTAFVDGKQWWHTDDTSVLPPGPMHLTIQLDWFPKGGGDVKPSQMQVDWVRQYALPESGKGGDGSGDAGGDDEGLLDGLLHRITEGGPDREPGSATRGASGT